MFGLRRRRASTTQTALTTNKLHVARKHNWSIAASCHLLPHRLRHRRHGLPQGSHRCCVLSILLLSVLSNKTIGKGPGMIVSTSQCRLLPQMTAQIHTTLYTTPSLTLSFTSTAGRSDPVERRPGLFRKKVSPSIQRWWSKLSLESH